MGLGLKKANGWTSGCTAGSRRSKSCHAPAFLLTLLQSDGPDNYAIDGSVNCCSFSFPEMSMALNRYVFFFPAGGCDLIVCSYSCEESCHLILWLLSNSIESCWWIPCHRNYSVFSSVSSFDSSLGDVVSILGSSQWHNWSYNCRQY